MRSSRRIRERPKIGWTRFGVPESVDMCGTRTHVAKPGRCTFGCGRRELHRWACSRASAGEFASKETYINKRLFQVENEKRTEVIRRMANASPRRANKCSNVERANTMDLRSTWLEVRWLRNHASLASSGLGSK